MKFADVQVGSKFSYDGMVFQRIADIVDRECLNDIANAIVAEPPKESNWYLGTTTNFQDDDEVELVN